MALSNIFNEPRREIIESAVGIGVVCVVVGADVLFAWWDHANFPRKTFVDGMVGGVILLALLAFLLAGCYAFLAITHAIGDAICNALERGGVHLRPRDRRRAP